MKGNYLEPRERRSSQGKPKNGKRHYPPSQTKLDVWFEEHLREGEEVILMFREDPLSEESRKAEYEAKVITVDRYHFYLDLPHPSTGNSVPVWVAKENILSAR